jgi:virulence factor Mce-like protein
MRARKIIAPVVAGTVLLGMFFLLKWRYGDFGHYYYVTLDLPRATQNLLTGADVRENGYAIGDVTKIELLDRHARLTLQIDKQYRVPEDAEGFVDLKTLLGEKFVDLRFPEYTGPWLQDGDRISGNVGPELEDALQNGVRLFDAIPPDDLATVIGNLAEGGRGHAEDIAHGLQANAELSGVFANSLSPQLRALRDFDIIFRALKTRTDDLNNLADAVNQGAPVYASPEAHRQLHRVLTALVPFSQDLGDLLILNRHEWDVMMDKGDVVLQTVVDHIGGVHDLVYGLYRYVYKLGGRPPFLADGSAAAPFTNFMSDDSGGSSFAATLRQMCTSIRKAHADVIKQIPACQSALGR